MTAGPTRWLQGAPDPSAGGGTADVPGGRTAPGGRVPLLQRPTASYHLLVGVTGLLAMLGLVMVLSASSVRSYATDGSSFSIFLKQLMCFGIGVPAFLLASRLPVRAWRLLGYPLLFLSLLMLLAVLVPGIGTRVSGATRWIDVGPLQVQPSEPAKLALALWGADLLVRKERLLGQWRHLLVPLVPVAALVVCLIMLEPDLGTTLTVLIVVASLLFFAGASLRIFGALMGVVAAGVTLLALVEPYRLARLTSFTDPFADAHGSGYQAVQGFYALASGGWWGYGLGASREKWPSLLPNAHTDYIFAIIGEELGLVGTLGVVILFAVLAYTGLRIATRTPDPFVRLVSGSVTAWLVGQALINMGYVSGVLPVTGVPLPLISFGGTSLVLTMFVLGMLASFARAEPGVAAARERERRRAPAEVLTLAPGRRRTAAPRIDRPGERGPAAGERRAGGDVRGADGGPTGDGRTGDRRTGDRAGNDRAGNGRAGNAGSAGQSAAGDGAEAGSRSPRRGPAERPGAAARRGVTARPPAGPGRRRRSGVA